MTTRILGGKGNRGRRSQKTSCRATTSRRPPTRYERSHTRKVNLCIIQVDTELGPPILGPEKTKEIVAATPLARLGQPVDIANAVYFLLSDLSDFMTGQTIVVSGGRVMLP